METPSKEIIYYDSSDLIHETMIERALKFVELHGVNPQFNNINLVLAAYNVYLLLTKTKLKESYQRQVTIAKSYIKICNNYFSKLNNKNIISLRNLPNQEYQKDYWILFSYAKLYNTISDQIINLLINKTNPNLTSILNHPQIVNTYSRKIAIYIIKKEYSILFILDYFFTFDKETVKKYTLPKELNTKILLWLINKELSRNNIGPQYLELIENSINTVLPIPDQLKVKAKRCRKKIESELLSNNSTMIYNIEIIFENLTQPIIFNYRLPNIIIKIDRKWIQNNYQNSYLFANLYIFNFICDKNYRAKFIAHKTQASALEEIFSKPLGINDYFQPLMSKFQEDLSRLFITSYDQFLLTQNNRIEDLLKWFYTDYISEEFNINNFIFNSSSNSSSYLEKFRNLCSEIDGVLKQYQLYYENGEIDTDLLEINSKPLLFSNIKSYDKNKFAYIVDSEYLTSMNQLFSDQSNLNFIPKLTSIKKSFISVILENNFDLFLSDFDNIQQNIIKKLQSQQLLKLSHRNKIIAEEKNIRVLKDFYENNCICNKSYLKQLDNLNIKYTYIDKLFSDSEIDYLNFILNKKQFSNSYNLRNKYIHGSQSQNKDKHLNDYYLLLMIHCFIALKIYDELANRRLIHAKN